MNKPMHPVRQKLIHFVMTLTARGVCFGLGYFWISEKNKNLKPNLKKAYICISNHVVSLDPIVYHTLGFHSYIAKEEVKKMPVFGLSVWSGQGMFVKRESKDNSSEISQALKERVCTDVHDQGYPRKFPVLMLFPESTTVNQTALLQFKRGAFVSGKPVSMVCIRYDQRFYDHSDASCNMIKAQLLALIGLFNKVEITYFGDYIPANEDIADPNLYSEHVREYYSQKLGWPKIDLNFKDKYYFKGKHNNFDSCSDNFRNNYGPQVTKKAGYVIRLQ